MSSTKKVGKSGYNQDVRSREGTSFKPPHTVVEFSSRRESEIESGFDDSLFDGLYDKSKIIKKKKAPTDIDASQTDIKRVSESYHPIETP